MVQNEGSLCPACGGLVTDDICPSCGFNFSSVITCPHLQQDNTCSIDNIACNIRSLEWEVCSKRMP